MMAEGQGAGQPAEGGGARPELMPPEVAGKGEREGKPGGGGRPRTSGL